MKHFLPDQRHRARVIRHVFLLLPFFIISAYASAQLQQRDYMKQEKTAKVKNAKESSSTPIVKEHSPRLSGEEKLTAVRYYRDTTSRAKVKDKPLEQKKNVQSTNTQFSLDSVRKTNAYLNRWRKS
jgi:hypothetical protein